MERREGGSEGYGRMVGGGRDRAAMVREAGDDGFWGVV